jgi:glyoxylase-like metal-dependent hydrolase (beta-lactamase superfamily II)
VSDAPPSDAPVSDGHGGEGRVSVYRVGADLAVHRYAKAGRASVNTYWIETARALVVVDGQRELSAAREARARMDASGKPIRAVFLTHPHPDHFGGIGVFAPEDSAVPLYASAQTRESIRADRWGLVKASHEVVGDDFPPNVRLPTHVLADNQPVDVDELTIFPAELGGGEAECMTALYLPAHGALFAADAVQHGMTAFLLEGRSKAWLAQLRGLRERFPGATTLYPGHGAPGPVDDLVDRQIEYLETFRALVARRGAPEEAAAEMARRYPGFPPAAAIDDLLEQDAAALRAEVAAEPARPTSA